jgi:hypothetical protein
MRSLELFLLHPLPGGAERARLPALRRLLSRARTSAIWHAPLEGTLMSKFDVSRQGDWPVAPLARLGDGQEPDGAYWLCADPIHLQVDRDALLLVEADRFELGQPDADTLVQALNQHFEPLGMQFSAPTSKRWYTRVAQAPDLQTVPLREAAGRDVDELLPRGGDALAWHRTFNELQMLLHSHSLNEAREARGELPVNSVWFWGGGTLPSGAAGHWVHVWARDALSRGLSRAAGIEVSGVRRDFADWHARAQDGAHLVVLDEADLDRIETNWIAPGLRALRVRMLHELSLSVSVGAQVRRFDLTRGDLWKFWRGSSGANA